MNKNDNPPRNYQGNKPGGNRPRNDASRAPRRNIDILPSPELLENYNYVVEGSAEKIIEMFQQEQAHRHDWEDRALRVHMVSSVLGQVLGFFIAVAIFVSASIIGIYGDKTIAATIWVFGMAIVVMAGLVWAYAKTLGQRPLFGRPTLRTHFRAEKTEENKLQD